MFSLEYTLFGIKFNLVIVAISMLFGWFICLNSVYACSKVSIKEGLSLINNNLNSNSNSNGFKLGVNLSGDVSVSL